MVMEMQNIFFWQLKEIASVTAIDEMIKNKQTTSTNLKWSES